MWRKIKLTKEATPQDAFVTIGNGQIHFGITACKMMPECLTMSHVEFFRGDEEYLIGVNVISSPTEDSVPIQRPFSKSMKRKDLPIQSFTVVSKHAIGRVFGDIGKSTESVKCKVKVDDDAHNMFIIDLRNPKPAKLKRD